ncbi:acyl-CoA synthetase (NDP forming)/RimJ/RimL family protein N-acetyltransferase [Sinomonas atrocyanea]|uniref:bifunctional acetate--CoA ligase family protein/GNAT family N-acetyltransferase n=1 Tax=Sinomonas atrocyanea TaxID=37927 RepID=UPI002786D60F|nr:bifunctional GNAT family N-acetyltransferase/acetate--CoA ligase family protein [Sinomonas atrocyanea]MDP9885120.1 acyl-CoA synthetase (NDP forming)/RimJ/RimL family protein N-acetyltransferase [Sinomonas atrocyanea]
MAESASDGASSTRASTTGASYPHHWEADVVLRDGGTAHLRPIRPEDAQALQDFHTHQSEGSIYLRFFSYKARLTPGELKRFTEVDHHDRVALVITMGDEIIGVGRYDRLTDPAEAEVAFNIADRHQGRGIGSILLEHLAAAARENHIRRFTAEVLPENRKMLTVFAEAGYAVARHFDDGVVSVAFEIDPTEKSRAVMESREHRAEARSIMGLLAPSSVAVIGASRTWGTLGYQLLEHIVEGGFAGSVYAVNPEALELGGMMAYGQIGEVPEPVDLAVVAVPYAEVQGVVADCAAAGVKGVVIASGGFAERGEEGLALQRQIVRHARAHGMRVVGPESLGIANTDPDIRLNASLAPGLPRQGSLGLFSQSASIGVALYAAAERRYLGFSSVLSAGNRADVSGNDLMQYWEDDVATNAVGLYFESFGNPRKFSRIARRLARSKPVIVAKSDVTGLRLPPGHSVRTTQAPQGALDAVLRQSGVIRVGTVEQLVDVAQIAVGTLPAGPRVAVLSNSLALARVVADSAEGEGLTVTVSEGDLDLAQGQSLALPELARRLREAAARGDVDAVVVALLPSAGVRVPALARTLAETAEPLGKAVIAAFPGVLDRQTDTEGLLPAPRAGEQAEEWPAGVPCYASAGDAVAALAAVTRYSEWLARDQGPLFEAEVDDGAAAALIGARLAGVQGTELVQLAGDDAARLLGCYGIPVLASRSAATADEAVAAADALGWPVAIKAAADNLRSRLDLGAVRLDIRDAADLRAEFEQMGRALAPYGGGHVEVQRMAPLGQACVVRAIEDPLLGPVLSFGLAGDAVSLLDDWAHRITPLTTGDVHDIVRSPRTSVKLFGHEGLPALDVPALEDLIGRVSLLKDRHPEVSLLELKPVVVSSTGLTVLSAQVWIGNAAQRMDSARRALIAQ